MVRALISLDGGPAVLAIVANSPNTLVAWPDILLLALDTQITQHADYTSEAARSTLSR